MVCYDTFYFIIPEYIKGAYDHRRRSASVSASFSSVLFFFSEASACVVSNGVCAAYSSFCFSSFCHSAPKLNRVVNDGKTDDTVDGDILCRGLIAPSVAFRRSVTVSLHIHVCVSKNNTL